MKKDIAERVEQVIRNIQRRKYSKIVDDYANASIDLFNENQMASDLGIRPADLEEVLPIRRHTSYFGGKGLMFPPTPTELRDAIPKITAKHKYYKDTSQ